MVNPRASFLRTNHTPTMFDISLCSLWSYIITSSIKCLQLSFWPYHSNWVSLNMGADITKKQFLSAMYLWPTISNTRDPNRDNIWPGRGHWSSPPSIRFATSDFVQSPLTGTTEASWVGKVVTIIGLIWSISLDQHCTRNGHRLAFTYFVVAHTAHPLPALHMYKWWCHDPLSKLYSKNILIIEDTKKNI